jgi:hypothetical protein
MHLTSYKHLAPTEFALPYVQLTLNMASTFHALWSLWPLWLILFFDNT